MKKTLGWSLLGLFAIVIAPAVLAQPTNDRFADRSVLSGTNLTVVGSNAGATRDLNEPDNGWFTNSVWWEWTSLMAGTLRLTVSSSTFAPAVILYDMGPDTNLYWVDGVASVPAEIHRIVYPDSHFLIAVGGPNGASGDFQLKLELMGEPPNGSFADRVHLGTGPCRTNGWLFLAEDQAVWYSWTAATNAPVTFTIAEPGLALSVFSGSTSSDLHLLASSEGRSYVEGTQATIEAQAGATYFAKVEMPYGSWTSLFTLAVSLNRPPFIILRQLPAASHYLDELSFCEAQTFDVDGRVERVDFYTADFTVSGRTFSPLAADIAWPFQCEWTNQPFFPSILMAVATDDQGARTMSLPLGIHSFPYNDFFTNRLVLAGSSVAVTNWFAGASREPLEPNPPDGMGGSVWYTWTAPFSGTVTMQAGWPDSWPDLGFEYRIAVFAGSELSSLTLLTNGLSRLTFNVSAGAVYQIAVYAFNNGFPLPFRVTESAPPQVQLVGPATASEWTSGSQIPISADAVDDGSIDHVDFYAGSSLIGSITNLPYTLLYAVPETDYQSEVTLSAVAFDNHGLSARSMGRAVIFVPRPPANDSFRSATVLTGEPFNISADLRHATLEPGEPNSEASVWYSWTAPSSRIVTLRVEPFSGAVRLAVFTGAVVSNLTLIQSGPSDPWPQGQTRISFPVVAGLEYRIAVCAAWWDSPAITLEMIPSAPPAVTLTSPASSSRYLTGTPVLFSAEASDSDGSIRRVDFFVDGLLVGTATNRPYQCTALFSNQYGLAWHAAWAVATDDSGLAQRCLETSFGVLGTPPGNDLFANRTPLTGAFVTVTGTTANATWEVGERGPPADGSVWWSWQAPETGPTTLVLGSGEHGAHLEVYAGVSIPGLTLVTNLDAVNWPETVSFNAVAGQEYQLAVRYRSSFGGPIWMTLGQLAPPSVTLTSPDDGASFAPGQVIFLNAEPSAPGREIREVAFFNYYSATPMAVATNAPWSTSLFLTNASLPWGSSISFRARVTDSHGLIGYSEARTCDLLLPRPANDLFENRLALTGCSLVVTGSTVLATGDGYAAGADSSVWWSWVAPQDGWLTLDAHGSGWASYFGVFTGSELTNLMLVASTNLGWYSPGRLAFPVTSGTSYAIEMATPYFMDGSAVGWSLHCGAPSTVTITSPADAQQFLTGSSILVNVRAETPDNTRPNLEFYLDGLLVQTLTNPPSQATITLPAPQLGIHNVQVNAVNEFGCVSSSPNLHFAVCPLPPTNDLFASRLLLHGFLAGAPADTLYATREPGEPDPFAQPDWGTLWYTWTAPASGLLRVQSDTDNPLLSIWSGSILSQLQLVATNVTWTSEVATPVTRGNSFQIACARTVNPIMLFLEAEDSTFIERSGLTSGGFFTFTFQTLYQQPWIIEGSTDLHQWIPLQTNSTFRNVIEFVDDQSWTYPQRFYRMRPERSKLYQGFKGFGFTILSHKKLAGDKGESGGVMMD